MIMAGIHSTANFVAIGFYDDDENKIFGYFRKREHLPQSNFAFIAEVICETHSQSFRGQGGKRTRQV